MRAHSHLVEQLPQGAVLDVTIEDLSFRAFVVVSEPDISQVAQFVPASQFEQDGDVHVTAVSSPAEARQHVEDLAFNMNPGDTAVFLCADTTTCTAVLEELGQDVTPH